MKARKKIKEQRRELSKSFVSKSGFIAIDQLTMIPGEYFSKTYSNEEILEVSEYIRKKNAGII